MSNLSVMNRHIYPTSTADEPRIRDCRAGEYSGDKITSSRLFWLQEKDQRDDDGNTIIAVVGPLVCDLCYHQCTRAVGVVTDVAIAHEVILANGEGETDVVIGRRTTRQSSTFVIAAAGPVKANASKSLLKNTPAAPQKLQEPLNPWNWDLRTISTIVDFAIDVHYSEDVIVSQQGLLELVMPDDQSAPTLAATTVET